MKRHISPAAIVVIAAFALSCFGLLLYLWTAFGGAVPLSPKGYQVQVLLKDAGKLTENADVRISGVSVGRVVTKELPAGTDRTRATIEIDPQFAPRPVDTRVTLRQKSLLGETFIELSPGSADADPIPEGGALDPGRVAASVRLDEVFSTFDEPTREAFATWMIGQGETLSTTARALSDALGSLDPFAESTGDLVATLDAQDVAVRSLLRDGSLALGAVTANPGELESLVRSGQQAFVATAEQDDRLAETVRDLTPFLRESRRTLDRLASFSGTAEPVVRALRPTARELSQLVRDIPPVAAPLRRLLAAAPALERASREGAPAVRRVLGDAEPLLERLRPFLGEVIPIIEHAGQYRRELAAAVANASAATQSTLPAASGGGPLHLLRAVATVSPESLAAYPRRLATSRANPYRAPGTASRLATGLPSSPTGCGTAPLPALSEAIPAELRAIVTKFALTPAPANVRCDPQPALGPLLGAGSGVFPTLVPRP